MSPEKPPDALLTALAEIHETPGPWQHEPDREDGRHLGFPYILRRGGGGAWCGYVGMPPGHPWHGETWDDDALGEISVHGGVTYAQRCSGEVCHVPQPGESDDVWWIGFDCGHAGDLMPCRATLSWQRMMVDCAKNAPSLRLRASRAETDVEIDGEWSLGRESYKTISYARTQTLNLVEQAAAAAQKARP